MYRKIRQFCTLLDDNNHSFCWLNSLQIGSALFFQAGFYNSYLWEYLIMRMCFSEKTVQIKHCPSSIEMYVF